jgi:hypothetical protein
MDLWSSRPCCQQAMPSKDGFDFDVFISYSSYVLQGADAQMKLAKLALARNDKVAANEHGQRSRLLRRPAR